MHSLWAYLKLLYMLSMIMTTGKPVVEIQCGRSPYARTCYDDIIRHIDFFQPTVELTCHTSNPHATIYWYKNGEELIVHSNSRVLRYTGNTQDDLLGVYQCFATTPAGVDYDTLRVLRAGNTHTHTHTHTHTSAHPIVCQFSTHLSAVNW